MIRGDEKNRSVEVVRKKFSQSKKLVGIEIIVVLLRVTKTTRRRTYHVSVSN